MSCRTTTVRAGHKTIELTGTQCAGLDLLNILQVNGEDACGEHACAYETPAEDTLIKITDDADDAAGFLLAKGSKSIVPAPKVVKLGNQPYYAIVVKKADPLTRKEQLVLNDVVNHGLIEQIFGRFRPKEEREPEPIPGKRGYRFSLPQDIVKKVADECDFIAQRVDRIARPDLGTGAEFNKVCRVVAQEAVIAIEDLGRRGITFTDAHAGNWGRYKGKLVAIDVGLSKSAGKKRIPTLAGASLRGWPRWR